MNTEELQELKARQCENGCLTIYLNTNQTQVDQKKGEWKIRLKNGLKKLEEYLDSSSQEEMKTYKKISKIAEEQILNVQTSMPRSLLFIGSNDGDWILKKLQVTVENDFRWERQPALEQLEQKMTDFPKAGILLIQKQDVVAIETSLGEVENESTYCWDAESEDWKMYQGSGSSERVGAAIQKDQFDQRFDANQQRWYKQLAQKVQKKAKKNGWNGIYLVGSPDTTSEFEKQLTLNNVEVIKKNLTKLKSHQIIDELFAS
ncbi:VLRF1 family aeRF1-type release factor [Alkalicoccobacillus porphyridii]|uniref:Protein required for attachment to host cells n=1 Tax=Alkalicoccobacillus porphyridii TaxID=2597270 RepID=A0A553ZYN5_9BACI|nr:VLRF1 family aeRF1-type release factor [Alkalicoccobacillus porphyridii]TSB46558.1 hypothetical protein FN960_09340 [Alkalicoccobacillus porphyridii]